MRDRDSLPFDPAVESASAFLSTDLFSPGSLRLDQVVSCVRWLRERLCFCPVFVVADVYGLLNGPEAKPSGAARGRFPEYDSLIREMADFHRRSGGKGIPGLFWQYIQGEGPELREAGGAPLAEDGFDSLCRRAFIFLKHLIRSFFPLVDAEALDPGAGVHGTLIEALRRFRAAYECRSIGDLIDGDESPFIAALEGFSRECLAADFDFEGFAGFARSLEPELPRTAGLIDLSYSKRGPRYELNTGDVDVEITTDLEKAERFFDSEWLKGDPFYLSGPEPQEQEAVLLQDVEKRIEEDGRELGLDSVPLNAPLLAALTHNRYYFDDFFLQGWVRGEYLKLRRVHQLSEAMFRLKAAFAGFESYSFFDSRRPRTEDMVVRIQIDATDHWNMWAIKDFARSREEVIDRVTLGLEIAGLLFRQKELSVKALVLLHGGAVTHEMSGDTGRDDFQKLFTRMYLGFALTGISSSSAGAGGFGFDIEETPGLAADIRILGSGGSPDSGPTGTRARLYLVSCAEKAYEVKRAAPGQRDVVVGSSTDHERCSYLVLRDLFSQLLSISIVEEETLWNR